MNDPTNHDSRSTARPVSTPSTRPPRQARTGLTSTGVRKAASKPPRSRAREFALQGLYQHLVGRNTAPDIDTFTRDLSGFNKADSVHYDALLHGCITQAADLDALIVPLLDRPLTEISPIERGVMWIGAYELRYCLEVPWRVVLNECVELAKEFGGTDGYKYVNGVLNGLAPRLRVEEIKSNTPSALLKPAQAAIKKEALPTRSPGDAIVDGMG